MENNFINQIINTNGTNNYAYVVMLIKKDIYIGASIVFAESIRKMGCLGDLVIMIDEKINLDSQDILKRFYDKIIQIEPIEINNNDYVQSIILSKIHAFELEEYKKIFLIDIETIIMTNIDKYFINSNNISIGYSDNKKNYGFILVSPDKNLFHQTIKLIKNYKTELEKSLKPFELLINKLFNNIKKLDIKISSINKTQIDVIQYQKSKPFLMSSNLTIEERVDLEHFKIWFSYFIDILNKYPEIKNKSSLVETIQVSKYFLSPMSRIIIEIIKSNKNKKLIPITNIYGKHKYNNLDYYHVDISKNYDIVYNISSISNVNNIENFLYLLSTISNLNYSNISDSNFDLPNVINYLKNIENDLLIKFFLNQYIKNFPNVFIIIQIYDFVDSNVKFNLNPNKIELKNNLLYKNKLKIQGKYLLDIMFNILGCYTYSQRYKLLQIKPNLIYTIDYHIFETITQIDLFNMINFDLNVFILFEKGSKIRFSSIFLNPNTILMFENSHKFCKYHDSYNNQIPSQSLTNLLDLIYFQTLKKWIYNNYSGIQIENIIIGQTNTNNKLILIDNVNSNIEKIKKINNNKIFFIHVLFIKSSQYKNILPNITNILETIKNPLYYWELEGIKLSKEFIQL